MRTGNRPAYKRDIIDHHFFLYCFSTLYRQCQLFLNGHSTSDSDLLQSISTANLASLMDCSVLFENKIVMSYNFKMS